MEWTALEGIPELVDDVLVIEHVPLELRTQDVLAPLDRFDLIALSGVRNGRDGIESMRYREVPRQQANFARTRLWTGEFVALHRDRDTGELLVSSDYFGNGNAYFGFAPESGGRATVVISSSFRGASAALSARGVRAEIDWGAALPVLSTLSTVFYHRHSLSTMRRGVRVLRPQEVLHISERGVSLARLPFRTPLDGEPNYGELIARGAARAVQAVANAVEGAPAGARMGLSGGRDSRAVLALVLAAGKQADVGMVTSDPQAAPAGATRDVLQKDLEIAARLVEGLDLRWADQVAARSWRLTPTRIVEQWQAFRSHQSYEFKPVALGSDGGGSLYLYGGGGELLRAYFGAKHAESYPGWREFVHSAPQDVRAGLGDLYDRVVDAHALPADLVAAGRRTFISDLYVDGTTDAVDALERFYAEQRSRTHHTIQRSSALWNAQVLTPLAQPELFRAHWMLTPEEQAGGRVIFDLIEATAPELNDMEFDSSQWPAEHFRARKPARSDWGTVTGDAAMERWRQRGRPSASVGGEPPYDVSAAVEGELDLYADRIADVLPEALLDRGARLADSSRNGRFSLIVRYATLADGLARTATQREELIIDGASGCQRTARESVAAQPASDAVFAQLRASVAMPEVAAVLERTGDTVSLVVPDLKGRTDLEWAAYLFRDGKRIALSWYGDDEPVAAPASPGRFRAQVFLRRTGATTPQKVVDGPDLTIE